VVGVRSRKRLPDKRRAGRGALPEHLPRIEIIIEPKDTACPCCGGAMHVIGEDRSQRLDVIPAQYQVIVTCRPKYAYRACQEAVVQAPAPVRLIEGGLPTERLVAHVAVAKYADHTPLYRQCQILARQGIQIDRSVLACWVGYAAAEVKPLWQLMRAKLLRSTKLFVDETTAPVLDPGRGRTKKGYFWVLARDDRPWRGGAPQAVVYNYAPGRGGKHATAFLAEYAGVLQTDAYAAYGQLADPKRAGGPVTLAFCWAHWRRQWFDIAKSPPAPIAVEVLERIAELYRIEAEIRGSSADERQAVRQQKTRPLVEALKAGLERTLGQLAGGASVAQAIRYGLGRWDGLTRFLDDGCVEIDSNTVERSMRPIATRRSLCPPSPSVWEHWKRVGVGDATRTTFSGHRHFDWLRRQVIGADLVWRSSNNLLSGKDLGFNKAAQGVVRHAQRRCRLGHGQPFAVLFGGAVGVDSAHAPNRSDAVRRPAFALASGHAHSIERRGDMFVRPATGHAPHHRQRVLCRRTAMLPGPRLTHPQLGVLASAPMDREDDLTRNIVDIDDDVGDQRPKQLLASPRRDTRCIPGRRQIVRQVGEGVRVDYDL
jgi:transposase